jgi:hypothetical protein
MTHPDSPLTIALRDLADQAAPPRLRIEAAWRTGRRRRWTAITGSVVGAAGVAAAAVLVPLTLLSAPTHPGLPTNPAAAGSASTHRLYSVEFRQVARITDKPCPPGSRGLPGLVRNQCFHLTHTGMRATRVTYLETRKLPAGGGYEILLRLQPPDRHRFAVLTRRLVGLPSPRNELADIISRVVVIDPTVQGEISSGYIQIIMPTQAQAHEIRHMLGIH